MDVIARASGPQCVATGVSPWGRLCVERQARAAGGRVVAIRAADRVAPCGGFDDRGTFPRADARGYTLPPAARAGFCATSSHGHTPASPQGETEPRRRS